MGVIYSDYNWHFLRLIFVLILILAIRLGLDKSTANLGMIMLLQAQTSGQDTKWADAQNFLLLSEHMSGQSLGYQTGLLLYYSGQTSSAVTYLRNEVLRYPTDELRLFFLGKALVDSDDYDTAQHLWESAGKKQFILVHGTECLVLNELKCAAQWAIRAYKSQPSNPQTWALIRRTHVRVCANSASEAIAEQCAVLATIRHQMPDVSPCSTAECHIERGRYLLYTLGKSDLALADLYEAALQLGEDRISRDLAIDLVLAGCGIGDWSYVDQIASQIPRPLPVGIYVCWGRALLNIDRIAEIDTLLQEALRLYPDNSDLKDLMEISKRIGH